MRDGQQGLFDLHALGAPRSATMQPELRRTVIAEHLDVFPQHRTGVAGAKGLHTGFLRCEARRERGNGIASPRTIGDLSLREDSSEKAVAISREHVGDPRNVGSIETQAYDLHVCSSA